MVLLWDQLGIGQPVGQDGKAATVTSLDRSRAKELVQCRAHHNVGLPEQAAIGSRILGITKVNDAIGQAFAGLQELERPT